MVRNGGMSPVGSAPRLHRLNLSQAGYNPGEGEIWPLAQVTVRQLRLRAGLSIREVERLTGISRGSLSQIERGRMIATRREADLLAGVFGLPAGSLVTRTLLVHEAA